MFNRSKILALAVLLCLPLGLLSLPQGIQNEVNKEPARFVISSWSYPDAHGQGIALISPEENSSVYWSPILDGTGWLYPDNSSQIEIEAGYSLRLDVRVIVNCTFLNVAEGNGSDYSASEHPVLNYIRLGLVVTTSSATVFELTNMTYDVLGGDLGGGLWYYSFVDILNFTTIAGEIYITTITYEIYYPEVIE